MVFTMRVVPPNAEVSDGSQPPMTFDLFLSKSAGSRSMHRLVGLSLRLRHPVLPLDFWSPRRGESPHGN
jgi:hypothetical protein